MDAFNYASGRLQVALTSFNLEAVRQDEISIHHSAVLWASNKKIRTYILPVSASMGDNLLDPSPNMPWFSGLSLPCRY